jgi:IS30 family transposase
MTTNQKQQVINMRQQGWTYAKIADSIGLSKNTVKTFCWRNKTISCDASEAAANNENNANKNQCEQCNKPLEQRPKQKPRRFCDDACRYAWWSKNRGSLNRKAVYPLVCAHCRESFDSYGNKDRKYCRHECYIAARFGNADGKVAAV